MLPRLQTVDNYDTRAVAQFAKWLITKIRVCKGIISNL